MLQDLRPLNTQTKMPRCYFRWLYEEHKGGSPELMTQSLSHPDPSERGTPPSHTIQAARPGRQLCPGLGAGLVTSEHYSP